MSVSVKDGDFVQRRRLIRFSPRSSARARQRQLDRRR